MTRDSSRDRAAVLNDLAAGIERQLNEHLQPGLEAADRVAADLQSGSRDPRLAQLRRLLAACRQTLDATLADIDADSLSDAAAELADVGADARAAGVIRRLLASPVASRNDLLERTLDEILVSTTAQRGYILLVHPDSSEAEVACARRFSSDNLSLAEFRFSRGVVTAALDRKQPILLADAARDPEFGTRGSVREFLLRSVLAVPLTRNRRVHGVIYLEDSRRVSAFSEADAGFVATISSFVLFYLQHARLLPQPTTAESRVFIHGDRVSREIVGQDPSIVEMLEVVERAADGPATVLITGESGTGKDLVARALHYGSRRRDQPFVAVNCAAIPAELMESEMFGHEKGAFTGATRQYVGRFEQASGGTLFLDEVNELVPALQAKLLRFLQSGEISRLGGRRTITSDARVVAASSRELQRLVDRGDFQAALFYRLNVVPIHLPPLRERRGDIELLAEHFLEKYASVYGRRLRLAPEVTAWLEGYEFPGNVRELENLIHRLVALAPAEVLRLGDLPAELVGGETGARISLRSEPSLGRPVRDRAELERRQTELRELARELERDLGKRVVEEAGGNVSEAARRLGVHRVTLYRLLRR